MNSKQLFRAAIVALSLGAIAAALPAPAAAQGAGTPAPAARSILSPKAPADAAEPEAVVKKATPATRVKRAPLASPALYARGSVVGMRAGTLVLAVGKKIVDIALGPGTVVKSAHGKVVPLSSLRKGEKVKVTYRARGARAASIDIL